MFALGPAMPDETFEEVGISRDEESLPPAERAQPRIPPITLSLASLSDDPANQQSDASGELDG